MLENHWQILKIKILDTIKSEFPNMLNLEDKLS